jgi:hypothetical protein
MFLSDSYEKLAVNVRKTWLNLTYRPTVVEQKGFAIFFSGQGNWPLPFFAKSKSGIETMFLLKSYIFFLAVLFKHR